MDKYFAQAQQNAHKKDANSAAPVTSESTSSSAQPPQRLPKGVVLGKDGKPCRSCTSVRDWMAMAKQGGASSSTSSPASSSPSSSNSPVSPPSSATTGSSTPSLLPSYSTADDCPPDVETLGNHTWTLLHSISATYPEQATPTQQADMRSFLRLFAKLYPCWVCAEDFEAWMRRPGNEPRVEGQEGLGRWMCEAHNEVNRKLGKREFDCNLWKERWRDGWRDGRCG